MRRMRHLLQRERMGGEGEGAMAGLIYRNQSVVALEQAELSCDRRGWCGGRKQEGQARQ